MIDPPTAAPSLPSDSPSTGDSAPDPTPTSTPPPPPPPRPPRPPAAAKRRWNVGAFVGLGAALFGAFVLLFIALYAFVARQLPSADDLAARASQFQSTRIYDRDGGLLYESIDPNAGRRTAVQLGDVSKAMVDATVATEDGNFYRHGGVDPLAVVRAVWYAVRERRVVSGASTIPQQLVKRLYLTPERSVQRKVKEAILATEISRRYPKERILEIYLNELYYGNHAYGIHAAARTYFGVAPKDLTLAQAALLAGLPQAPSLHDPYTNPEDARARRDVVLGLMADGHFVDDAAAKAAAAEPIDLQPPPTFEMHAPHFVQYVRQLLEAMYGAEALTKYGFEVTTTLDARSQLVAERTVAEQVAALNGQGASNGALVALEPATGEVVAFVGSADFGDASIDGQVNMALAPRQPGSTMKPLAYLTAFEGRGRGAEDRWSPGTLIPDIEVRYPGGPDGEYVPHNYDRQEHGIVTARVALGNSYNIPAVRTMAHIGLPALLDMARRLGITTLDPDRDYGLSLVLGSGEVPLLEMTGAFAVLATGGVKRPVVAIRKIVDSEGQTRCESGTPTPCTVDGTSVGQQVVSAVDAFLVTDVLRDPNNRRPAFEAVLRNLSLADGRPAAVKTGTTDDYRDSLTIGYTPDLVTGVWVGNADRRPMKNTAGSIGAAPIWSRFMSAYHQNIEVHDFSAPDGIAQFEVCADTGTLPSEACPERTTHAYAKDGPPLGAERDLWQMVRLDPATGLKAADNAPDCLVERKPFKVYPDEFRAWAEAHGIPQPPADTSPVDSGTADVEIGEPDDGDAVVGDLVLAGTANVPGFERFTVLLGAGRDPSTFDRIAGPFDNPVTDGVLARVDLSALAAGDYVVRVTARDRCGNERSDDVRIRLDNPTATPSPTAAATLDLTPSATVTVIARGTVTPLTPKATAPGATPTLAQRPTLPPPPT
ncbi:MAG: transglycosylase domain-containing protein, partial [Ardenticatenales bacterium]